MGEKLLNNRDKWLRSLFVTLMGAASIEIFLIFYGTLSGNKDVSEFVPWTFHTLWEVAAFAGIAYVVKKCEEHINLLKETQYDRVLSLLKSQEEIHKKEVIILNAKIKDLRKSSNLIFVENISDLPPLECEPPITKNILLYHQHHADYLKHKANFIKYKFLVLFFKLWNGSDNDSEDTGVENCWEIIKDIDVDILIPKSNFKNL